MRIAVVGTGIAGLSAAWLLNTKHEVVLYEANSYAGGHSNTVDVMLDGITHPVDTGFLVHNERTYPNLISLLSMLEIDTPPSDMSFSVSLPSHNLEWAGSSLGTLFAQPLNLIRPSFWRMVKDILRFNRESTALLDQVQGSGIALAELLDKHNYGAEFRDWYLYPMGAAIWSSPLKGMEVFPAETFLKFCLNHGLLQIFDRPQWRTINRGSREYVNAMLAVLPDVRLNTAVQSVRRNDDNVIVTTDAGEEVFDRVIMACHTDQSLHLLKDALPAEKKFLSAIHYQPNVAWLHTDVSLMPKRQKTWSAWNYYSHGTPQQGNPVAVTYWLNRLQKLPFKTDIFVTLNPPASPAADKVIERIEYAHPLLDTAAYMAQKQLPEIQGINNVYFCGAWAGYGFHEDGLIAGMEVARLLGATVPWER